MSQHSQFPQHDGFPSFGLPDQPPDSPDLLNTMDGLGGHSSVAAHSFGHYPAMPTRGAGGHNTLGNLTHVGNTQNQQNFGLERDIYNFIRTNQAEPWNPVRAAGTSWPHNSHNYSSLTSFTGYRDSAPPSSEAGTVGPGVGKLSDSGYGSVARPSIGIPSYNGDDTVETQSLARQFNQHGLGLETRSNATQGRARKSRARSQRGGGSVTSGVHGRKCPECPDFSAKTNSELKKHRARHEKPFKCHIERCPKAKEGFSTSNDLDRHRICVHHIYGSDAQIYRCNIDTCRNKPKNWPRQDNFRQHIKRVHRFDPPADLSAFLYHPKPADDQPLAVTSEHAPSEAGRHISSNQSSQLQWPVLDQGQAVSTVVLSGTSTDLGAIHPGSLHHYPTHSVSVLDHSDYASIMSPTEFPPQEQHILDNPDLSVDMEPLLRGLIQPRFQQNDESTPRELPLGDHSCISPNMLGRADMEICHMEQSLEIQTPPREVIHLDDDSPAVYQEEPFADYRQAEPELSVSPDAMALDVDEPVQGGTSDNGSGFEDADVETEDVVDLRNLTKLSEHLASECTPDKSSSPELLATPSPPADGAHTPDLVDQEDVEASALAALKSLMSLKDKGGLKEKGVFDKLLLELGYQKSEELEAKELKTPGTPSAQPEVGSHKCKECPKSFSRLCELKKHLKRHEKPYACTFYSCDRRFGSKNDWKRHENSQHYQLEIWRCAEVTGHGTTHACGKVYHRRESLRAHLEKDHQMKDSIVIERKLADCRHGRNFESRFWCGFCVKTIEPTGCDGPAHSERFDHIDDHFMGRNGLERADMATWKSLDALESVEFVSSSHVARNAADNNSRKRGLDGPAGASLTSSTSAPSSGKSKKSKRRGGKAEVFWNCCNCGGCWNVDVTNQCLEACNHTQCRNCITWENDMVPEKRDNERAAA